MTLKILDDLKQGSDEWLDARRGMVTASTVSKLITVSAPGPLAYTCPDCLAEPERPCIALRSKAKAPIKTIHPGRSKVAADQADQVPPVLQIADNDTSQRMVNVLAAERISGFTEDTPMTSDMWRGREAEPFARAVYAEHIAPVTEVGFMVRDDWGFRIGYSPDGLVGDDGLIEIKSPRAHTQVTTTLVDDVPAHYMAQCQTGLLVSGRAWVDFVSYVGGMPLFVKRVLPDPEWQAVIVAAAEQAERQIDQIVAAYLDATKNAPATERVDYEVVI